MIGEIVGNAIEHANSQCLLDIDVTTDHSKCVESEVQDGDFYGINIVILNFSDVLFGDKIKKRIENEELDTDDRYIVLKKAYNNHKKEFDEKYNYDDFVTWLRYSIKYLGQPVKEKQAEED